MNTNFDPSRPRLTGEKNVLAQILSVIAGVVILCGALMFSLVFFAVVAVVVLVFGAYFWWKTRALRKQIREQLDAQMAAQKRAQNGERSTGQAGGEPFRTRSPERESPASGDVIEGEAVRVDDERSRPDE